MKNGLLTFSDLAAASYDLDGVIGKKGAALVKMHSVGFNVPSGGCICASDFRQFLQNNHLVDKVSEVDRVLEESGAAPEIMCRHIIDTILASEIPSQLQTQIEHFIVKNSKDRQSTYAVRSSATKEDGVDSSFAGLFVSFLNIQTTTDICNSIKKCWASVFETRVLSYCADRNIKINDLEMGVVIQQMVMAQKSGVTFSIDPISGRDTHVLTEACFGLGEGLVSGHITPDRYIYDWYAEKEINQEIANKECQFIPVDSHPFVQQVDIDSDKQEQPVLSNRLIKQVTTLAVDVQKLYGFPVDIEWAIYQDELYLLQARPITAIQYLAIDGEWTTADFKDGGVSSTVCTPFMWSLYNYIWQQAMPTYLEKVGLIESGKDLVWGDMFYGRPYWNVGEVKRGLKRLPGFVEREFDESLGIRVAYEGDGHVTKNSIKSLITGLRVLYKLGKSFAEIVEYSRSYIVDQSKNLQQLESYNYENTTDDEFFEFYRNLITDKYFLSESSYFNVIYDNSNVSTLFSEFFTKINKNGDIDYLNLISGLTDLSHLDQSQDLWIVIQEIQKNRDAACYWLSSTTAEIHKKWREGDSANCLDIVSKHIERFKYHSNRELDITVPRFGEDPRPVFESIKQLLDQDGVLSPKKLAEAQQHKYLQERDKFIAACSFWQKGKARKELDRLRKFLWLREELRDLSTKFYYYIRKFSLELEQRLIKRGMLQNSGEIFFLTQQQVLRILSWDISDNEVQGVIKKNKTYYASFRNYSNPDELGQRFTNNHTDYVCVDGVGCINIYGGIGCSPGVIEGQIKIIRDISDANRLDCGDILVTKFTDPGWTPKFGLLSAVITETGGVLSHAAVISREYGIPAVLAVPRITTLLKEGQRVIVDGANGKIKVIE